MNKISLVSQKHPFLPFVKPIITILFLLLGHYFVAGQSNSSSLLAHAPTEATSTTWEFLSGAKKMYYIDFDEVKEKLEVIQVTSAEGQIVFKENVADLSSKTFYELNLSKMEDGEYYLEIEAKHKTLRKLLKLE